MERTSTHEDAAAEMALWDHAGTRRYVPLPGVSLRQAQRCSRPSEARCQRHSYHKARRVVYAGHGRFYHRLTPTRCLTTVAFGTIVGAAERPLLGRLGAATRPPKPVPH